MVVLLIIGENHELRNIDEFAETLILHPLLYTVFLCKDSFRVVWFLDFDKAQWHSVDKTSDIWAEAVTCFFVFTCEFCGNVPLVVAGILKINEFCSTDRRQLIVEFPSEVVITKDTDDIRELGLNLCVREFGVNPLYTAQEYLCEDICFRVILVFSYLCNIGISKPHQMQCSRNLNTSVLVEFAFSHYMRVIFAFQRAKDTNFSPAILVIAPEFAESL